jgi:hypothetical protein
MANFLTKWWTRKWKVTHILETGVITTYPNLYSWKKYEYKSRLVVYFYENQFEGRKVVYETSTGRRISNPGPGLQKIVLDAKIWVATGRLPAQAKAV